MDRKEGYRPHIICLRLTEEENQKLKKILTQKKEKGISITRSEYLRQKAFAPDIVETIKHIDREIKQFRVEIHYMSKELQRGSAYADAKALLIRCSESLDHISNNLPSATETQDPTYGKDNIHGSNSA